MRSSLSLFAVLSVFFSYTVNAALPPLSQEMRESMATNIVSGNVMWISSSVMERGPNFSDTLYRVTMMVSEISKGNDIQPGDMIEINYRRLNQRPRGWVGPVGQNQMVRQDSTIRTYMTKDSAGDYHMLEPNGFDTMEEYSRAQ